MTCKKHFLLLALFPLVVSCSSAQMFENPAVEEAHVTDRTRAGELLASIPEPTAKIPVSLYDFQDMTGQFRNNEKFTDYSSAVTKGGHAILTKALLDAGNKKWFTVVERGGFKDLMTERNIIETMRRQYQAVDGGQLPALPPLLYSGLMIEGAIVSYDSNIVTGGVGATYLGLNDSVKYNRDMVTIYLRAVKVETGEVILSVNSSKTIFSVSTDANLLKYVTFDRLLEAEAGFTVSEPVQLAVRQAIETGVYSLVMEGAAEKIWNFKDPAQGQQAIHNYLVLRDGEEAVAAMESNQQQMAQSTPAAPVATMAAVQPSSTPVVAAANPAPNSPMQSKFASAIMSSVKSDVLQHSTNTNANTAAPAMPGAPQPQL